MDPDANLDEQLDLVKRIVVLTNSDGPKAARDAEIARLARDLADMVEALDHWITGGGFLPARWKDVQRGR